MGAISVIRIVVLALSTVFSVVVLGLAAHLLWLTSYWFAIYFIFCALGVAAAGLSLLTLPVMLVTDFIRRGAFTSMVVVELVWLFILWILWVATAAEAVNTSTYYFPYGCIDGGDPIVLQACHEVQAIEAFSFLVFIILLVYTVLLLISALVAASRGDRVWLSSVRETTFFRSSNPPAQQHPMGQYNGTPAPQHQAVPQQYVGTPVQPQYIGSPVQPQYTGSTVPSQQPYPGIPGAHSQAISV
ncbi:hypothetical protein PAXRUDRAFT_821019 [Paxillus rubicundulus Ve08.2h10]|uniref:MARVEL domain-containing protein n=1 Tax=Paxillus rubicundulus Ve08.2h10 TaxID=930991 RepID=A0A0D0E742_9AGAM|nr:hypothetical protein PAXRUDRAFT_821019 [Paxillus rubicundulus Ve08.2h10]